MSAIEKLPQTHTMPFALRPLEERDIVQAVEIERDAFPTLFPPTSFRQELKNRTARYLVAWKCADGRNVAEPLHDDSSTPGRQAPGSVNRLLSNARNLWTRRRADWDTGQPLIAGFAGTWYMVDEAHIVSVGVRSEFRGQGIGELLLIGAIEQAMQQRARTATLEVRVSNRVAQNLYAKYGFKKRGARKAYYTDNREDAIIMTTDSIQDAAYIRAFSSLAREHELRWGYSERILA